MSDSLPTDEIKWLDPTKINFDKYEKDSLADGALKVDLEYHRKLHQCTKIKTFQINYKLKVKCCLIIN